MNKFKIIYCDPPYSFTTYSDKGKEKSPEQHYSCMTIEDIYNLPINEISDDNSVLFLWVTFPLLQEGLECIRRWKFTYKTCAFNWFKKNKIADSWFYGMGYYYRANTEICLLATKGKPLQRISKSIHQIVENGWKTEHFDTEQLVTKVERHSKKPDIAREKIIELFGDLPRIELFARENYDGWTCLGNEISGNDIRTDLYEIIKLQKVENSP